MLMVISIRCQCVFLICMLWKYCIYINQHKMAMLLFEVNLNISFQHFKNVLIYYIKLRFFVGILLDICLLELNTSLFAYLSLIKNI